MFAGCSNSFLSQLLNSEEFSDLTFFCGGEAFKVHKAVVCMQSAPIKAAVQGGFQETETNAIVMDSFQPSTVKRLVQFMYTGDYDDPEANRPGPPASQEAAQDRPAYPAAEAANSLEDHANSSTNEGSGTEDRSDPPPTFPIPEFNAAPLLLDHIRVNSIGDYYQVERLVSLANSKIKQLLRSHSNDESWVATLPIAIEEAIELTGNKELLKILAEAAAVDISTLLVMENFKSLSVMSDFSFHVMQGCVQKNETLSAELAKTMLQLWDTERQLEAQKEALRLERQCLQVLGRTSQCRNINCTAEFQCYIDPNECILRCAVCRCKHQFVD